MVHYMVPCDVHDRCIFLPYSIPLRRGWWKDLCKHFACYGFPCIAGAVLQDCCILPIIVLEPSLPSAFCLNFFYCSEAKPGLRILSPGFSEQSATDSFSTPFIRSEFLSEICSKADADLNRKVFLKSSLQCNALERRFQKMHFPISFLDSSPIPWSPHLCRRIPWDGNGSLIFLFCAHFGLQEFVCICKNLFIIARICLYLQEFV